MLFVRNVLEKYSVPVVRCIKTYLKATAVACSERNGGTLISPKSRILQLSLKRMWWS